MSGTAIVLERLDHLVLTVRDVPATCDFYRRVMGMEVVTFGAGRKALRFGRQKINLHQAGDEFEPKARVPTPGSADLCLVVQTPLGEVVARLREFGIDVLDGPVGRTGALGSIESVYIRDPDGNLIELCRYV